MKVSKGSKLLIVGGIVLIIGCLCIYNMVAYETQKFGYDQKYTPITLDSIAMFYLQNFWLFSAIETARARAR